MYCWKCNTDCKVGKKCQTCHNFTCSNCLDYYCLAYQNCDNCMQKEMTIGSKIRGLKYLQDFQSDSQRTQYMNIFDEKGNLKEMITPIQYDINNFEKLKDITDDFFPTLSEDKKNVIIEYFKNKKNHKWLEELSCEYLKELEEYINQKLTEYNKELDELRIEIEELLEFREKTFIK